MSSERADTDRPTVTVVITTKNRAELVTEAIDSVLALSHDTFVVDLVVVDDGSTDSTPSVLGEYPGLRCIRTAGVGMGAARSLGLQAAVGQFVTFLDDDDVLLPDAIRVQLEVFAQHPEYALVHAQAQMTLPDLTPVAEPFPPGPLSSGDILPQLLGYFPQVGTIVTRIEAARAAGEFDGTLPGDNDWDWLLRVAKRHPVGAVEVPVLLFRMRAEVDEELAWRRFPAISQIFHRHTDDLPFRTRLRLRPILWRHQGWCASVFVDKGLQHWSAGDRRRALRCAGYALRSSPLHGVVHGARRVVGSVRAGRQHDDR